MRFLPKTIMLFLFSLLLLFLTNLFPKSAFAAGRILGEYDLQQYNADRKAAIDAAKNNQTLIERRGVDQLGLNVLLLNITNTILCTDPDPAYCDPNKTAMGNITLAMQAIYANPPANLALYVGDVLAHAGLVKPAYAQGIGFAGLSPLLGIWKATRNIAYAVIVIIMVAIGFMIIFRMKIDPKTVISIQAALPKIVLTLLIITFSYAIVGFLIDLMYLVMAIVVKLMAEGFGGSFAKDATTFQTEFMAGNVFTLLGMVFSGGMRSLDDFFKAFGTGIAAVGVGTAIAQALHFFTIATGVFGGPLAAIAGAGAVSAIFLLILVLGLLFTFIRLLMLLFNSYVQILLSLILGPILLLREAVPGQSAFGEWILNIMANLVVFPATAAVLLFASYLTTLNQTQDNIWSPPLAGMPNTLFAAFLGISVTFMAPTLVASIKKLFHPKPALPITAATPLSPLTGAISTGTGALQQFYYFNMTAGGIPVIGQFLRGKGGQKE